MDITEQFEKDMNKVLFKGYASKAIFCHISGNVLDFKTVLRVDFRVGEGCETKMIHTSMKDRFLKSVKKNAELMRKQGIRIFIHSLDGAEEEINY